MILGSGLIAQSLSGLATSDDICVFATGVSDSTSSENSEFLRERKLMYEILQAGKRVVYFSSQAVRGSSVVSPYYTHKREMESLILSLSANSCIVRLPQVCGPSNNERQLLGFLFKCISEGISFNCYKNSVRNMVAASTLKFVVSKSISDNLEGIHHFCSPFDFFVWEIVAEVERFCGKPAVKNDIIDPSVAEDLEYLCSNEFHELQIYRDYKDRAEYLRSIIGKCLYNV